MLTRLALGVAVLVTTACTMSRQSQAEDWSTWRGPRADGTSAEKDLPTTWSATENVKWKTPLPGPGNSTPIVLGNKIFLTQATDKGARRGVMCFDRETGKELWSQWISFTGEEPTHEGNPYCSASVATDGEAVYAWHGSAGVVAYDLDGKELWKRDLGQFTHIWGNAGTPVVYQDLVIINCAPGPRAFVIALNKKTGEQVWKVDGVTGKPDAFLGSWSSPKLTRQGDQDLLLVGHPHALVAYNPTDGKEIWKCEGLTDLVYTTPVVGEGVVVAMSGYHGRALGVRLGGTGNVTESLRLWITPDGKKELQRIGSGIIFDGHIYMVNEPGIAECIELETGETLWKKRLSTTTWSSLVLADGKFYILDQEGATYVFAAKPELEVLAKNELGEYANSSHAISGGNIFIRTDKHLWCIGK